MNPERKKKSKWDVPAMDNNGKQQLNNDGITQPSQQSINPTQMARERALALAAKLAASGKLVAAQAIPPPQPNMQRMLHAAVNPSSQQNSQQTASILATEIKQNENGYLAEVEINDFPNRNELASQMTIRQVCQQSGASVDVRGSFIPQNDKEDALSKGYRSLYILIESTIQAKVQVALHKLYDLSRMQTTSSRHQPSDQIHQSGMQFVQDKVFVGLENINPEFNLKERLEGPNSSYLQHISTTTGAKVHLRGRGSGFAEPTSGRESFEALHVYISHPHPDGLGAAKSLCENLIQKIHNDYRTFNCAPPFQGPPPQPMYPPYQRPMMHQMPPHPQRHLPPPMNNPQHFHTDQGYGNQFHNDHHQPVFDREPRIPMPHSQEPPIVSYPTQVAYPGQMSASTIPHYSSSNQSETAGIRNNDHNASNSSHNRNHDHHSNETLRDQHNHDRPLNEDQRVSHSAIEKPKEKSPPRRKRKFTEGPLLPARKMSPQPEMEKAVSSRRLDQREAKDTDRSDDGYRSKPNHPDRRKTSLKDEPFKAPSLPAALPSIRKGKTTVKSKSSTKKPKAMKGALASLLSYGDDDDDDDSGSGSN